MDKIILDMYSLLKRISDNCTENFSGIGIVVYDERVLTVIVIVICALIINAKTII